MLKNEMSIYAEGVLQTGAEADECGNRKTIL
jgi:hypothetical protein